MQAGAEPVRVRYAPCPYRAGGKRAHCRVLVAIMPLTCGICEHGSEAAAARFGEDEPEAMGQRMEALGRLGVQANQQQQAGQE